MKPKKSYPFAALLAVTLGLGWLPHAYAQNGGTGSLSYLIESAPEPPKTATDKLEALQKRQKDAFEELSVLLNRLPVEPSMLGSKDLFSQIDKADREMANVRSGCTSLITALKTTATNIRDDKSFTEAQKKELLESAEEHAKNCNELSERAALAVKQLAKAYTLTAVWKKTHSNYLNLQGASKASAQVKAQVEEYLNSFTPKKESEPDPVAGDQVYNEAPAENNKAK